MHTYIHTYLLTCIHMLGVAEIFAASTPVKMKNNVLYHVYITRVLND